jgi:hypothetical protein
VICRSEISNFRNSTSTTGKETSSKELGKSFKRMAAKFSKQTQHYFLREVWGEAGEISEESVTSSAVSCLFTGGYETKDK